MMVTCHMSHVTVTILHNTEKNVKGSGINDIIQYGNSILIL